MPLAPGTALQNGHYVIDALLEAASNGDLYWGTHVVTGMQVFVQVFPVAPEMDPAALSALIARFQGVSFSPQSPLPQPFQLVTGDDHTLCLVMGTTVGLPWSQQLQKTTAMAPKQALTTIRQVAAAVTWLQEQGIAGLDLSPNRVWMTETGDRITLTGLPQTHLAEAAATPIPTVQALARLLYSFLLGEWPATDEAEPLKQILQQRLPNLSPLIGQAIYRGAEGLESLSEVAAIRQWLSLLPDAGQLGPGQSPQTQLAVRPRDSRPASSPSSRSRVYPALGLTALVAAIGGVTLGTVWRLQPTSLPGAIEFDPNQSFPARADWSGDRPEVTFDTPFVPAREAPGQRQDWWETDWDTPVEPEVWEAPASDTDWAEEEGEVIPEDTWDPVDEDVSPAMSDFGDDNPAADDLEDSPDQPPTEPMAVPEAPAPVPIEEAPADFADEPLRRILPEAESKAAPAPASTSEG
jgi:hypothetical protein